MAQQPVHQRSMPPGPLVLRRRSLKIPRLQRIGDQPVSRRFEPSSRISLIGEQPNPWDLLQPQDEMSRPLRTHLLVHSRIATGVDYIFALPFRQNTGVLWRYLCFAIFICLKGRIQSLRGLETDLVLYRRDDARNNHIYIVSRLPTVLTTKLRT